MVVQDKVKFETRLAAQTLLDAAPTFERLKELGILDDEHFVSQVRGDLSAIAKLTINEPVDSLRVRVGSYHIKLKKSLWQTVVAGTVAVLGALDPTHLTKATATIAILQYLAALKTFLAKLDTREIEVYDAVAQIVQDKRANGKMLEAKEVSELEVAQLLGQGTPANLRDILSSLVIKGGLVQKFRGSSPTLYSTVF